MNLRAVATIAVCAAALVAGVPTSIAGGGNGVDRPPKVLRIVYEKLDNGYQIDANSKRTNALSFRTRYDGRRVTARARQDMNGSVSGIPGRATHPWEPIAGRDRKRLLKLIDASMDDRGKAKVKVIARGDGGRVAERFVIELAECNMDPPLYPLTCVVEN